MARGIARIGVAIHISREKYTRIFGHKPDKGRGGTYKIVEGKAVKISDYVGISGALPDLGEVPIDYDPANPKRFFDGSLGKYFCNPQKRLDYMKVEGYEFGEPRDKWPDKKWTGKRKFM